MLFAWIVTLIVQLIGWWQGVGFSAWIGTALFISLGSAWVYLRLIHNHKEAS